MEEIWKNIIGFEGYQASNLGRIKSLKRVNELIMSSFLNKRGYLMVSMSGKSKQVHQLVAIAFLNHTPCGHKLVINHKNFIRTDNRVENLEIVTSRENCNQKHLESSSQFVGVGWCKFSNKWRSRIRVNGKDKCLGLFDDELEASEYYENALTAIQNETEIKVRKVLIPSEHKGVTWTERNKKWRARIKINGVLTHLGYFKNKKDACKCYDDAFSIRENINNL